MEQDGAAVVPNASKPAEGPAPDLSLPTVEDAVKDVPAVESTAAPLVEGGDTPMIVEDEVQVAEEAQAGMPVDV